MIFSSYEVILDLLTLYYPSVTLELPYLSMIFMVIFYLYGVILCLCLILILHSFVNDRSYLDWTFCLLGFVLQLSWLHLQVAVVLKASAASPPALVISLSNCCVAPAAPVVGKAAMAMQYELFRYSSLE